MGFADDFVCGRGGKEPGGRHANGKPSSCNELMVALDLLPITDTPQNRGCSDEKQEDCGDHHSSGWW